MAFLKLKQSSKTLGFTLRDYSKWSDLHFAETFMHVLCNHKFKPCVFYVSN